MSVNVSSPKLSVGESVLFWMQLKQSLPLNLYSLLIQVSIVLSFFQPFECNAEMEIENDASESRTGYKTTTERMRIRYSSEVIFPALQGDAVSQPSPDGGTLLPMPSFHTFWMDYEVAPNYRIVYTQRAFGTFASNDQYSERMGFLRDPKIGIRRTDLFAIDGLDTSYDLFVTPTVTKNFFSTGNQFEIGVRASQSYTFPQSKWTLGLMTELSTAYLNTGGSGPLAYGFTAPWASYTFNHQWSTQHWANLMYKNMRTSTWNEFEWDIPRPFFQNGLSYNFSEKISATVLLNHYFTAPITFRNSWVSAWFSWNFL